jgi:hypothetical protein
VDGVAVHNLLATGTGTLGRNLKAQTTAMGQLGVSQGILYGPQGLSITDGEPYLVIDLERKLQSVGRLPNRLMGTVTP